MLCPSFGLGTRAQNFASEEVMAEWEQTGSRGKLPKSGRRCRFRPFHPRFKFGAIPCIRDVPCMVMYAVGVRVGEHRKRVRREQISFCSICPAPLPQRIFSLVARTLTVFPLSTGGEASVPWNFVGEAKLQPDYPAYVCPAAIVHGLVDEVVPVAVTRSLVEGRCALRGRRRSGVVLRLGRSFVRAQS